MKCKLYNYIWHNIVYHPSWPTYTYRTGPNPTRPVDWPDPCPTLCESLCFCSLLKQLQVSSPRGGIV